jgi:chemotaxis protein MotB
MKNKLLILAAVVATSIVACVPKKKFTELSDKKNKADQEIETLRNLNEKMEAANKECNTSLNTAKKSIESLSQDTTKYGKSNRSLRDQVENLSVLNDTLTQKMNTLLVASSKENRLLLEEIKRKEEAIREKEGVIKDKENLIKEKESAIAERETKLKDLQQMMAAKDSASNALKDKLSKALEAFKNKGLTVTEKDGKVYVSMEAKLLFASGSTAVDENGKKALVEIAEALKDENDVEIVVEGHTDTDKLNSAIIPRDNWELSVLRATEVVKIMSANSGVQPQILSAAGRSEYHPVDEDDKSKNRRIEIIIQPSMKEIYQWIEKN